MLFSKSKNLQVTDFCISSMILFQKEGAHGQWPRIRSQSLEENTPPLLFLPSSVHMATKNK